MDAVLSIIAKADCMEWRKVSSLIPFSGLDIKEFVQF